MFKLKKQKQKTCQRVKIYIPQALKSALKCTVKKITKIRSCVNIIHWCIFFNFEFDVEFLLGMSCFITFDNSL